MPSLRLPHIPWDKRWVVFARHVARPGVVLDYLARYVHRTALSDKAITACDDRSVTFNYRDSGDGRRRSMTLPAREFLRRFLQHVPLRGLHRVRAFGLLHPAERTTLGRLQLLLASHNAAPVNDNARRPEPLPCPHCHQRALRLVRRLSADECAARLATGAPSTPSLHAGHRSASPELLRHDCAPSSRTRSSACDGARLPSGRFRPPCRVPSL